MALLAARRGVVAAGALGLAATLALALGLGRLDPAGALGALARGIWLALPVVLVLAAGLLFHLARTEASPADAAAPPSPFAAVFLLGPFAECATGFGVGWLVAFAALRSSGLAAPSAALLGLFSQTLVPWGALAVGTRLGAELAGLDPRLLGLASARLTAVLLVGHLLAFELLARRAGLTRPIAATAEDALWLGLLAALLMTLGPRLDPELVGLVASGALLALRWARERRPDAAAILAALRAGGDYAVLLALLLALRLAPPLRDLTGRLLVLQPAEGLPPLAVLRSPALWLAAVALGFLLARRGRPALAPVLVAAARTARIPCLATLLLVAMAAVYSAAGLAQAAAAAMAHGSAAAAVLAVPAMAGLAGFLTGSNAASNSLLVPTVAALAETTGLDLAALAGIQNTVGSTFTLLSPPRLGLAAALAGAALSEAALLARAAPVAGLSWLLATLWTAVLLGAR